MYETYPEFSVEDFINDTTCTSFCPDTAAEWIAAVSDKTAFSQISDLNSLLPSTWGRNYISVYRGNTDHRWGLRSTLSRTLADAGMEVTEANLSRAELAMLSAAKGGQSSAPEKASWSASKLGLNMSQGELLAVLQHQGSPTRFIDVTESPQVALFFACERNDSIPGRLFHIAVRQTENEEGLEAEHAHPWLSLKGSRPAQLPWPNIKTETNGEASWSNKICLVRPGNIDPRIAAQEGLFLVGGQTRSPFYQYWQRRNLSPKKAGQKFKKTNLRAQEARAVSELGVHFLTRSDTRSIAATPQAFARTFVIPADLKSEIRNLLSEKYGIGPGSIYPDFAGFRRLAHYIAQNPGKI